MYFEDTYYLGAGKNGERGYRVLVRALEQTCWVAVGTFTWRGKITPIASRGRASAVVSRSCGAPPFPPFRVRCPFAELTITRLSPLLIEPDVRFSRIRLSDGFHTPACAGGPR